MVVAFENKATEPQQLSPVKCIKHPKLLPQKYLWCYEITELVNRS